MHVHFICTGNVYRSRLAETYFRSQANGQYETSSSGIHADANRPIYGPLSWYALRMIQNEHLIPSMTDHSTQTTRDLLDIVDLVIFMEDVHLNYAVETLQVAPAKYEVWHVTDVESVQLSPEERKNHELTVMRQTEETFEKIKKKIDELLSGL